ncbi:MAG: hypothetical protein ABI835_19720 [Chloroflexota bacterium]
MIRLTVLYNLPEGTDEAEFLRWRLGEHQQDNASGFGVVRTDFGRISEQWTPENRSVPSPYRFMTIVDYPDRETFERSFYADTPDQGDNDLARIVDTLFLVSEIMVATENTP